MKHHPSTTQSLIGDAMLPPPDPQIVATLRAVAGEPPYGLVDWDLLRASIVGDAAALLTRRVRRSWTTYVARWSSATVPLGVAASLVAGLLLIYTSNPVDQSAGADENALSPSALLNTITGRSSGTALTASVTQSLSEESHLYAIVEGTSR